MIGDLRRVAFDERHTLVLDALPLARFERVQRFAFLVQQQPLQCRTAAGRPAQ